jgi:hypothetical protein
MAKRVQFRRGTTAQHAAFIGAPGEITVDTDKKVVVVHDGVTAGGFPASINSNPTFNGTATFNGTVNITSSIASTSETTGSLIVTGGVGVSGRITVNNAVVTGAINAGSIVETSSIAYKENISPITNALDSVLKLSGVLYDRKDKSSLNESGLIKEEVEKILPNVVKDDGIKYTKIIAYLIEAIKEQQTQIEELKKKV